MNVTAKVRKPSTTLQLQQFTAIAELSYYTNQTVDMRMDTLAVAQRTASTVEGLDISRVVFDGSLELVQLFPIQATRGTLRNLYDDDYFMQLQYGGVQEFLEGYI